MTASLLMGPIMYLLIERIETKFGIQQWNKRFCHNKETVEIKMQNSVHGVESEKEDEKEEPEKHQSLYSYYWFIYGSLLKQGSVLEPVSSKNNNCRNLD